MDRRCRKSYFIIRFTWKSIYQTGRSKNICKLCKYGHGSISEGVLCCQYKLGIWWIKFLSTFLSFSLCGDSCNDYSWLAQNFPHSSFLRMPRAHLVSLAFVSLTYSSMIFAFTLFILNFQRYVFGSVSYGNPYIFFLWKLSFSPKPVTPTLLDAP